MSVKKLSDEVQSLFCSINITSFLKAVEELVYNSLDAKATSIAIRVHIEDNKIQVIDNGCGISKQDLLLLGERYATSKYIDISNFKSVPKTYGFCGQSIASIVDVSKFVKITSKLENEDVTWAKIYYKGKQKDLFKTNTRPSRGTTVEINGFLYNLKIKSKSINVIQEICALKTLLKQISLIHNNVSLSLRDDNKNKIIFKMHKNRDMYQILKLLFNIDKTSLHELKVEKNLYKAFAFIGKANDFSPHHWIFLNNRFLSNCKLHQIISNNYLKYFGCKNKTKKSKNVDDYDSIKTSLPFYVIFLTCPYYDYDTNYIEHQPAVEFKDWKQISKLLEKLISFYAGDIKLIKLKTNNDEKPNIIQQSDIQDKIRQAMKKIMGSNSKQVRVSQMQNGVKGKLIKRKKKISQHIKNAKTLGRKNGKNESNTNTTKIIKNKITKSIDINTICILNKEKNSMFKKNIENNNLIKNPDTLHNKETSKNSNFKEKEFIEKKGNNKSKIINLCGKHKDSGIQILDNNDNEQLKIYDNGVLKYNKFQKRINKIDINKIAPPQKKWKSTYYKQIEKDCKNYVFKSHDLLNTILGTQNDKVILSPPELNPSFDNFQYRQCPRLSRNNDDKILPTLTFQSHNYKSNYNYICNKYNNTSYKTLINYRNENNRMPKQFISKQSKENFVTPKAYTSSSHFYRANIRKNQFSYKCNQNQKNIKSSKWTKYYDLNNVSSHTVEIPKTIESVRSIHEKYSSINQTEKIIVNGNQEMNSANIKFTYTITSSNITMNNIDDLQDDKYTKYDGNNRNWKKNLQNSIFTTKNAIDNLNHRNVVFGSNLPNLTTENMELSFIETEFYNPNVYQSDTHTYYSQILIDSSCDVNKTNINNSLKSLKVKENREVKTPNIQTEIIQYSPNSPNPIKHINYGSKIDPPNVCETIMDNIGNNDYETNNINKSLDSSPGNNNQQIDLNYDLPLLLENTCHTNSIQVEIEELSQKHNKIEDNIQNEEEFNMKSNYFYTEHENNSGQDKKKLDANKFRIKDRFRYLPKGMSPIFEYCDSKNICDKDIKKRYFKNILYNNFINDVQTNAEVYEAKVQNTKTIEKVNDRIQNGSTSLTFTKESLKDAIILAQVDNKFIATVMKGNSDHLNYLVLFDQHAVHERISLENNLSDYFKGDEWKSVKLDNLFLKLSEEEILYLHNYKEKFTRFGLDWDIFDGHDIKIYSIPAAILGKNSREVDKIMIAVKNLIMEEIHNITSQKGCVSLYPKAIMDLVFNEACRYAIKFGDALSKTECVELIASLSTCNTPFQCAHGRPVMAIIMDLKSDSHKYQINTKNLRKFKTISCKR